MGLEELLTTRPKTHLVFDLDETLFRLILPWNEWLDGIRNEFVNIDPSIVKNYEAKRISLSVLQNEYVRIGGERAKKLIIDNAV